MAMTNVTDLNSAFVKMCEIAKEDQPLAGCARYLAALHELCQQSPGLLIYIHTHVCVCVCLSVCMHMRIYICMCVRMYVCVCVCVLYTHTHTHARYLAALHDTNQQPQGLLIYTSTRVCVCWRARCTLRRDMRHATCDMRHATCGTYVCVCVCVCVCV
jgi:hypothetical protein